MHVSGPAAIGVNTARAPIYGTNWLSDIGTARSTLIVRASRPHRRDRGQIKILISVRPSVRDYYLYTTIFRFMKLHSRWRELKVQTEVTLFIN